MTPFSLLFADPRAVLTAAVAVVARRYTLPIVLRCTILRKTHVTDVLKAIVQWIVLNDPRRAGLVGPAHHGLPGPPRLGAVTCLT